MPSTMCQILFKELMVQGEGRCVIKWLSFVEGNGRMEARAGSYVEKRKKQAQLGFGGEREKQGCLLEDGRFWANIKGRARISPAKSWEEVTGVSGGRGSRAGTETPRWDTLPRVWGVPDGEERWGCWYRQGPPGRISWTSDVTLCRWSWVPEGLKQKSDRSPKERWGLDISQLHRQIWSLHSPITLPT